MNVGFLAWNTFQVAHFAQILTQFDAPDVIFTDRQASALKDFDPQWLTKYGAYSRFVPETDLHILDGQYDAILAQNTPPLKKPWKKTKLIMTQYSLAKPKTAYNGRWLAANAGLVYGPYSGRIISQMCPVFGAGNSRFDPLFDNKLDANTLSRVKARLDPNKKTVLFLPTWGDLSSGESFAAAIDELSRQFNVLYKPHHMSQLGANLERLEHSGLINANEIMKVLDIGPYLLEVADIVISDMSGAIFDALYCRRPVILMGLDLDFQKHRKAEPTALEIAHTDRIGPVVTDPNKLVATVYEMLDGPSRFAEANEMLVAETFTRRGGCAQLAAEGIEDFLKKRKSHHDLQAYAAPALRPTILSKTYTNAAKRQTDKIALLKSLSATRPHPLKNPKKYAKTLLLEGTRNLPPKVLEQATTASRKIGFGKATRYLTERSKEAKAQAVSGHPKNFQQFSIDDLPGFVTLPRKAVTKRRLLNKLRDDGNFFNLGHAVECWADASPHASYTTAYQYYCAASNLRFSRRKFQSLRDGLRESAGNKFFKTPAARRGILRNIGLLSQALEGSEVETDEEFDQLKAAAALLGPLVPYLDCASENEDLSLEEQRVCTPSGEWTVVSKATGPIFEVSIMLGYARPPSDEMLDNRKAMVRITQRIVEVLHKEGWTVLPRLQAGHAGAVPITTKYPSVTWHTTDSSVPHQLHLKVGSFSEYIVLDDKGYSGWASLADQKLSDIISGVRKDDAEAHFHHLQESLIAAGRTKYAQTDEEVPKVGKYVFLPMQVTTDTVAQLAFINGLTLLETLIDWAQQSDYALVVKRHPKCTVDAVQEALEQAAEEGHIVLSNAPIHALISGADAVVTVNSGVGAEALLHLKPVITTGGSDYAAATAQVRTREELLDALSKLPQPHVSPEQIKAFLWVFTKAYQLHPTDDQAIEDRVKALLPAA